MKRTEITVTSKGHCNLSGVRTQNHSFYLAEEAPDGVITLTPAALVPARLLSPQEKGTPPVLQTIPSTDEVKERYREMPLWGEK
jgi:hypothetical protein